MKSKASWITHRQNKRLVLCRIQAIESIDIQPVLCEDLWKPSDIVWSLAASETVRDWIGHVARWIRQVERLAVPAGRHGDGRCKAVGTCGEAGWEADCVYIGMVITLGIVTSMAEPAQPKIHESVIGH